MMIKFKHLFGFGFAMVSLSACSDKGDGAPGPADGSQQEPLSSARLVIDETDVAPGASVTGRFIISLAEGWHTYSDPPGDSGMAPIITFSLPDDWSADLSPLPEAERFEDESGVTFGYEEELSVGFRLRVSDKAVSGSAAEIQLSIQYLICNEICLPQSADLRAGFNIH
ncbi:MAG: protein-disulfide reductase DsbD family protein [Lentisphaeria bacterium]|nr:protein-disulfide reductase DsbD family protein [Lentisphaeria bacterium]